MTSAPTLHIRVGVDVYSAYGNEYIGSVVRVLDRVSISGGGPRQEGANPTGSEAGVQGTGLTHEEGHEADHAGYQGRRMLGEEMGPEPTIALGNGGPERQSASQVYATDVREPLGGTRCFVVRPGRINLGPLTRPLYIPTSAIASMSMERIVIEVAKDRMPQEWRHRPSPPPQH